MRLTDERMRHLPDEVERFRYDRAASKVGIVHFGIGAFHRAHQAWYTDACLNAGETNWMIAGVSLRSDQVARQLNPQDGLYTITTRSGDGAETRLIGSVRNVWNGWPDRAAVIRQLASPECHIASFTVTEKGYAMRADGSLDLQRAESSFYPVLAQALGWRMASGLSGLTLLSCDNLADNGSQLRRLLGDYIINMDPRLAGWFSRRCSCPGTMVDRIVPATTAEDLAALETRLGLRDEGAVFTEGFSQWVIEDDFVGPRPRWEDHGAQIVADVAPYETAKLRMLNGAHSALAYLGLERGHQYVHQAIADPELRKLTRQLMLDEAATSFSPAEGQDLSAYADQLVKRFENPALAHRLIQIAMDGSQKIPPRWLETLAIHQSQGRDCPAILTALAAWIRHVRGDRDRVNDPEAGDLEALWQEVGEEGIIKTLFGPGGKFAKHWQTDGQTLQKLI